MMNPGGTGSPIRVISARFAPLPPSRSLRSLWPSAKSYTSLDTANLRGMVRESARRLDQQPTYLTHDVPQVILDVPQVTPSVLLIYPRRLPSSRRWRGQGRRQGHRHTLRGPWRHTARGRSASTASAPRSPRSVSYTHLTLPT